MSITADFVLLTGNTRRHDPTYPRKFTYRYILETYLTIKFYPQNVYIRSLLLKYDLILLGVRSLSTGIVFSL